MENNVYIYGLKCPLSGQVKYIGKTNDLKRRYYEHNQTHRNRKSKKNSWIISLKKKDLSPIMEVLEKCCEQNWEEQEKKWIRYFLKNGYDLKNIMEGGGRKDYTFTKETRKNMSIAQQKRRKSMPKDDNGNTIFPQHFIDKLSKSAKSNKKILNNLKLGSEFSKKNIIQLDKNKLFIREWESLSDASRYLNINVGNISKCLKGKIKTSGGYIWKYKSDYLGSTSVETRSPSYRFSVDG